MSFCVRNLLPRNELNRFATSNKVPQNIQFIEYLNNDSKSINKFCIVKRNELRDFKELILKVILGWANDI